MNFLNKLGLGAKKHPNAPLMGQQKKKQEEASSLRNNIYLRSVIILIFLALMCFLIPQSSFKKPPSYSIGEPWKQKDLTAPFTFSIQKNDKEIKQEEQKVRENTLPIYDRNKKTVIQVKAKLDSLFQSMQPVFQSYKQWKQAEAANTKKTEQDSLSFIQKKNASYIELSDDAWAALLQNYQTTAIKHDTANTKKAPSTKFVGPDLHKNLQDILDDMLQEGVINQPKSQLDHKRITLRNLQKHTEQTLGVANVRDVQQASEYARYRLSQRYHSGITKAGLELFKQAIQPNLVYNGGETQDTIKKGIADISTTKGAITKGQVIIRKGAIITPEKYNVLKSLSAARSQHVSQVEHWLKYSGQVIAIIAILIVFFFYLYLYRPNLFRDNPMLLLILLTISMIVIASSLLFKFTDISLYIIPVAIAPIILTIIIDSRLGIVTAVTLALLVTLINGNNFEFATATIVGCCLGLFSVRDIKNRSQFFFTTPGIVFLSYVLVIIGFSMALFKGWQPFLHELAYVAINAIFIIFTYPLILLFERGFNITTDLTLIELSDTNLPLLKELMNKAPGTFHHSLQVANLSEAAATAIGANGLLCRTAALYHDIGKMENPAYFAENQIGGNEHDKLKPRMSALVIKAHVSNGVKMAREHNLPAIIIDFIKTHHGTSVIRYFYKKACEHTDSEKDEIQQENFRYDGPLPNSKETGILMLADGVEAASRAMKEPNYQKLENLIDKLVDNRVSEGQLNNTPLTFQDLSIIKNTFLNILVGIYHSRVEYPEGEEEETGEEDKKKSSAEEEWRRPQTSERDYYNS
jgi:putative nucleotidyltransferase with HDIG domain